MSNRGDSDAGIGIPTDLKLAYTDIMGEHQENTSQVKTECLSENGDLSTLDCKHLKPENNSGQLSNFPTGQDASTSQLNIKQEAEVDSGTPIDLRCGFSYTDTIGQNQGSTLQLKHEDSMSPDCKHLQPQRFYLMKPDHSSGILSTYARDQSSFTPQFTSNGDDPTTSIDVVQEWQQQIKIYACSMCQYSCNGLFELYKHTVSHSVQNSYMCDLCQSSYEHFIDIEKHLIMHISEVILLSEQCDGGSQYFNHTQKSQRSCEGKQRINLHVVKHEEKTLFCDKCTYSCSCEQDLDLHKKQHLNGMQIISDGKKIVLLKQTQKSKHQNKKAISCKCQKKSEHISQETAHVKTNLGNNAFSCDQCEDTTADLGSSRKHKKKQTIERRYPCDMCDYAASYMSHLRRHIRKHTGEKPYSCGLCEYAAVDVNSLKRHLKKHTGEKPYSCGLCKFSALDVSSLKRHLRIHTGEKPYSCDLCHYTSSDLSSLRKHQRKHTGETLYSCDLCSDYTTSDLSHLKRHKRCHTGEKPYSCDLCEYTAADVSNLKRHLKKHTGEKPYS